MSKSSIRRRDFIAGATAITTGAALNARALASGPDSLYHLSPADFVQLIGQPFSVQGESEQGTNQRGTMVLKEVVQHENPKHVDRPMHLRSQAFSLRFETQDSAFASGTHLVSGGGLEPRGIFLHEMLDQRQPGQRHYEAVFN